VNEGLFVAQAASALAAKNKTAALLDEPIIRAV